MNRESREAFIEYLTTVSDEDSNWRSPYMFLTDAEATELVTKIGDIYTTFNKDSWRFQFVFGLDDFLQYWLLKGDGDNGFKDFVRFAIDTASVATKQDLAWYLDDHIPGLEGYYLDCTSRVVLFKAVD